MRRSIVGVMILAWRPGIADLLGLESSRGMEGKAQSAWWRARGVGAVWFTLRRRAGSSARATSPKDVRKRKRPAAGSHAVVRCSGLRRAARDSEALLRGES